MKFLKTPKSLELSITTKCNLRCTYCSHFSSSGDVNQDLPKEEWLIFFNELNSCAVMNLIIGGGEPFIRKDIKEIIEGIVNNRMRFSILSNGTLINDDIAAFIASTSRCDYIQISVDGSKPENHDFCRGNGNFVKAIKGIKILQKYKIPVTVRVTIHKHNIDDLEEISRFLLEDLDIEGFSTNSASYMGLCRQNADNIQLSVEDQSNAMKILLNLNKKYNGRIGAAAGPLADANMWTEMEQAYREKRKLKGRGYLRACGGVLTKMAVRADGIMVPCVQMSHIELGRINKNALKDIWQNHPELNRLRNRRDIPLTYFEFCKECQYESYCTGNCPALAYTLLGEENHPSPDSCLKLFLKNGGVLPTNI